MQTKNRQLFATILSVLVSVFLVAGVVMAVTTVSNNVSIGGTLAVTGVSTLTGLLNANAGIAVDTSAFTVADTTGNTVIAGTLTANGNVTLGDAVADTAIFNGRITTGSEAGSELSLGTSYTRGEGLEMRYGVDSWTGIAGSFKGYYFRTEANVGHATYGLRGMEVFSVLDIDSGTTGIGSLTGLYSELLVKAPATSFTIAGYPNAIEANFSYEAATAGTTTITNGVAALVAKIQTATGLAAYNNLDGIRIIGRDADAVRVMGDALAIENDAVGSHATWTNAIAISAGAATGINITGAMTTADISLQNGETISNATDGTIQVLGGTLKSGDNNGVNAAGGRTMVYGYYRGITTAITGTGLGVRGDARQQSIDSPSGTLQGGLFKAGNGTFATATDGGNLATMTGVYAEVASTPAGGTAKTVTNARGVEINLDLNQADTDITNAYGIYMKWNAGGTADYGDITNGYGLWIDNEAVGTTGQMLDAAVFVSNTNQSGGVKGWDYGIDLDSATINTADIRLQNGETISNATDSSVKITSPAIVQAYDADDYWTATQANSAGVTFDSTSAGTAGFTFSDLVDFDGKVTAGSFGSPLDVTSARKYGFELHYSGNNYDVTGIRSRASLITTDASTKTAQGAEIQVANADGIDVSVLNGALIEAIGKSDTTAATISTMRGLIVNTEWNAKDTVTDLRVAHIRTHTRNAATEGYVSGTGYGVYIENEAVGGNGQALDAAIYLKGTNLSAGNKAFTYGLDMSGATIGTADIRLSSGALIMTGNGAPTANCAVGSMYLNTGGTWAGNTLLYLCEPANTWTAVVLD